mmetsp:Transcript_26144/g.42631  ORF Transcript_26144/g.42631 Transcript_26144/m.42631 type:complete len:284 (-) Transcript_26144:276-1127(-)
MVSMSSVLSRSRMNAFSCESVTCTSSASESDRSLSSAAAAAAAVRVHLRPRQRAVQRDPRVLLHLGDGQALVDVDGHDPVQQPAHFLGEPARVAEVRGLDLLEERAHAVLVEGQEARQQHVQDHAAGPEVGLAPVVPLVGQHLGGHVIGRPAGGVQQLHALVRAPAVQRRQAEVRDLKVSVLIQQQVLGLQIPVADPAGVAVLDPGQQLPEVEPGLVLREPALGHNLVEELPARDHLQHDEDLRARGQHLDQPDHVRVRDHLHDADLLFDLGPHVLLLNCRFV